MLELPNEPEPAIIPVPDPAARQAEAGRPLPVPDGSYLALFCDGGVCHVNPSPIAGTWSWVLLACGGGEVKQIAWRSGLVLPGKLGVGETVSNNQTEYHALGRGLSYCAHHFRGRDLFVFSDSHVTLQRAFKGAKTTNIPPFWVEFMETHRSQLGRIEWALLDGHPTREQLAVGRGKRGNPCSKWNVLCDLLCGDEAKQYLESDAGQAALRQYLAGKGQPVPVSGGLVGVA